MRVILFFTYGISLIKWKESGLLDREIKFYQKLNEKYDVNFTFITYGDSKDMEIIDLPYIKVVPIYKNLKEDTSKFLKFFRSLFIPFVFSSVLKEGDIFKTNQLLGSWVAIMSKILYRKPLIIRTGYDLVTFTKKNNKGFLKIVSYSILTRLSLFFSNLYLVTSNVDKNYICRLSKFNSSKVRIRPNWIERQEIKNFIKRFNMKLISVGRLEYQKNYHLLLEGIKGCDIELDIYGEGSLKYKLQEYAVKNSLKVNIHKPISNKELVKKFSNYKIFVSTSDFEGNPKAILEAMSCGCVVIAKENENINEIITDGKNGLLFSSKEDMVKKINRVINDADYWNVISNNAYESVIKTNLIDNIVDHEYKDYEKLNFP